jgi:CHAT domain-containing protein
VAEAGTLVVNLSMAQDLVPWPARREPGVGALLVGGVDYGRAAERAGGEPRAIVPPPALAERAPRGQHFGSLTGTAAEVRAIAAVAGDGARVVSGSQATEAAVRRGSKGRGLLHLATHGFVRSDLMRGLGLRNRGDSWLGAALERHVQQGHDPLLLAGLALAGANTGDGGSGDDGILTALEASQLDLEQTRLVVLSACRTALGQAESGEGVIGLVRGFKLAGARRVVGSLWKVDDEATRALMVKFYAEWGSQAGGLSGAAALRRAQSHVRSQQPWSHPYYWAAWVLWGAND